MQPKSSKIKELSTLILFYLRKLRSVTLMMRENASDYFTLRIFEPSAIFKSECEQELQIYSIVFYLYRALFSCSLC